MIKYEFQRIANNNVEKYELNKQVKQYFSEVTELKEVKKFKLKNLAFLILLGGKNVGKSYWALLEMLEVLKNGGTACYMRNTLEEIKSMKFKLLEMVQEALGEKCKVTDECITNWERTKIYVKFIQSKNYNKLSGNQTGYDILIYDEFNQILNTNAMKAINDDFFNIINTVFRNKPWRVIACGNTKTKNNLFFNKFNISPQAPQHNIELLKLKNEAILFISYLNTAFKHVNANEADYALMKKYDRQNYNQMFLGNTYESEDENVVNNWENIKHLFTKSNIFIISNNRLHQVNFLNSDKNVWFLNKTEIKIDLELLNYLLDHKAQIYGVVNADYVNLVNGVKLLNDSIAPFLKKLKNFQLFFDSYDLYYYFMDAYNFEAPFIKSLSTL